MSNLFHHLHQWNKLLYEESVTLQMAAAPQSIKPVKNSFKCIMPYKSYKWQDIKKAMAYYITKGIVRIAWQI